MPVTGTTASHSGHVHVPCEREVAANQIGSAFPLSYADGYQAQFGQQEAVGVHDFSDRSRRIVEIGDVRGERFPQDAAATRRRARAPAQQAAGPAV